MKSSCVLAAAWLVLATSSSRAEGPFNFDIVKEKARELAAKPYEKRPIRVPDKLLGLNYDQHRDIRFKTSESLWRKDGLPFEIQFFHPGFIFKETVLVNEVVDGKVEPVPFEKDHFDYGHNKDLGDIPTDMGFSGFRLHYALNNPDYLDELAVFQGASYFRALGRGLHYGLSARGLALNSGENEEFPIFEEFWIEKPEKGAKQIVLYALLDGKSVAGAYRFVIKPGDATVMDIQASVYIRDGVKLQSFGMAPLTSMFWFAENSGTTYGDLRPEVHDSDGLLMERGNGEWIFRPLTNPAQITITAFNDNNPKGFGLVQRERDFEHYQDLEAFYHKRPSAWVEPLNDWGEGQVRLVELNTQDETNDNIVAFWVPAKLPPTGTPVNYSYRLFWFEEGKDGIAPPAGYVIGTRFGHSKTHEPELTRVWVDFDGEALRRLKPDAGVEAVVSVGDGAKLTHQDVQKNPFNNTWRAALSLKPDGSGKPVELRCYLKDSKNTLTETWSYLWTP